MKNRRQSLALAAGEISEREPVWRGRGKFC